MPPIQLNRRRFLSCSAAAGFALTQAKGADSTRPVRIGMIGLGNRGTTLLRACLDDPNVTVAAVADLDLKNRVRAAGIVEKARKEKPEALESIDRLLERSEIEAVVVALPCDLHANVYERALKAGKHVYAEKPLGLTLEECDRLIAESVRHPEQALHVGFQRRSNPRYRDAIAAIHRGDLGELLSGSATLASSNGPISGHDGWLGSRARSGDWMVEQAVHVWDVYHWLTRGVPMKAYGRGRRDVFRKSQPDRDVTDTYQAMLQWSDGFSLEFSQTWIAPADDAFTGAATRVVGADGGFDFATGAMTFRDRSQPRQVVQPGNHADTALSIAAFMNAVRSKEPVEVPVSLAMARAATVTGLMVRKAVDENRVVMRAEVERNGSAVS